MLKSLARISLCEFKFGKREVSLFMKLTSSQFGVYMLASTTGVLNSDPDTITNHPWGSEIVWDGVNNIFVCIKIAAPRALMLKLEWKLCPTQFFLSLT